MERQQLNPEEANKYWPDFNPPKVVDVVLGQYNAHWGIDSFTPTGLQY